MSIKDSDRVRSIKRMRFLNLVVLGFPALYLFLVNYGMLSDPFPHGQPSDPFYYMSEALRAVTPWVFLGLLVMMWLMFGLALKAIEQSHNSSQ